MFAIRVDDMGYYCGKYVHQGTSYVAAGIYDISDSQVKKYKTQKNAQKVVEDLKKNVDRECNYKIIEVV